mgnify:CR=1 FL=1
MDLNLWWQALLHFLLDSSEQEWLQDAMQLLDDLLVPLLLLLICHVFLALALAAKVEPLVEVVAGRENLRQQKIQQGPELVEVVLQRGTGEQEPIPAIELAEALGDLTVFIFELVGLVDNDVLPFELEKLIHAGPHTFESRQTDIELAGLELVFEYVLSLSLGRD